jgi:hypothetical protein
LFLFRSKKLPEHKGIGLGRSGILEAGFQVRYFDFFVRYLLKKVN